MIHQLSVLKEKYQNLHQIITTRLTGGLHQGYKPKSPASA